MSATGGKRPGAWRSFALLGIGALGIAAATWNFVDSRGGPGAPRWLLIAIAAFFAAMAAGLALDWKRMDGLTKGSTILALVLLLAMVAALAVVLPGTLSAMWDA